MPALDWIFAAVLLFSMVLGAWRGLVYEVLSLVNWVLAFVLAQWLALDAAQQLPMSGASAPMRYAAGFLLVFVLVILLGGLVVVLIKKLTAAVGLNPLDRALGALFGVLRGVLLLLLATVVVHMTPMKDSSAWRESVGAAMAEALITQLKPVLPHELNRFLPV
ncbi:CvpA family protein [Rhodoferax fermentans]|uniref:Colicin V synthesis protein n=1 Tax=Rhodoferax fermentans TaxID=28066 RepID=A0A1T1AZ75_RHOFE|nr:CvpA family protein [Rhodoferax fermentans]MBK1685142.1 colicin V synthesis protein [Rhodoferax fermentans]OOV09285.1 colicin V synthesis protein [Rhodoferax fermentans]